MASSTHHDRFPAEHLLDCIWRLDLDLRIVYVSPAAEAMFGIPADALTGSPLADHIPVEDQALWREMIRGALGATDRTAGLTHEARIKNADGRLIPVEFHGRLLLDSEGQPVEIVGIARDISGRRARERRNRSGEQQRLAAQKMAALARLAGGLAPDLAALLASLDQPLNDEERAALRDRTTRRLEDLLALAGQLDLRPDDLDVDGRLAQILTAVRATLPLGVELVHQPGTGGATVWADPVAFDRVVRTLVDHACLALGDGGGMITVTTGLRSGEIDPEAPPAAPVRPWVTLEVRDTGRGLDHATRERIFEPFPAAETPDADATFGLAPVHGLVGQLGGRIEVDGDPDQGSTFRVLLPARFVDDILAATPAPAGGESRQTILLVDDDPDIRSYCERVLRSGGFDVVSCEDGVDALAVIAGGEPVDAVVLDWALPGLDGRRVREQIARRQPRLPLLVISGHASKDYEALGGVDQETPWLAKPFTPPALLTAVQKLLPSQAEAPGS